MRFSTFIAGAALSLGCQSQGSATATERGEARQNLQPAAERANPSPAPAAQNVSIAGVASCQPSQEVSVLATRWTQLADADANGSISRTEADTFANLLVGGFFFRADSDANGAVSPQEGRAARTELLQQYPGLAPLLEHARSAAGESPFKSLANVLDVEYGQPLSADDARKAAQSALDELFRVTDTNKDSSLSQAEARAAAWQGARSLGQQVFRSVDGDKDGNLALQEFQKALNDAARLAFDAADTNNNQQLSQEEAAVATNTVIQRLGMPQPPQK